MTDHEFNRINLLANRAAVDAASAYRDLSPQDYAILVDNQSELLRATARAEGIRAAQVVNACFVYHLARLNAVVVDTVNE